MNTFKTIAIDPGTSTIGVSIFTINAIDLSIVDIETVLIDTAIRFQEVDLVQDMLIRLNTLHDRIKEIITCKNTDIFLDLHEISRMSVRCSDK